MDDITPEIEILYARWVNQTASDQEVSLLFELLDEQDVDRLLAPLFKKTWSRLLTEDNSFEERHRVIVASILNKFPSQQHKDNSPAHRVHFLKTGWSRYAAAVIVLLGFGVAVWVTRQRYWPEASMTRGGQVHISTDILPGGNKAILTLADGSTIVLDSAADGALAQQGNTKIIKLNAGSLAYKAGQTGANREVLYNTIRTPKGGLYQVVLPDGSQVWLNAASSIRFPTLFVKERKVMVTGEVYFEIKSDRQKPFSVSANGTEVEVLGTRFNINAYPDEAVVKTTLADGKVKVLAGNKHVLLQPGEQAIVPSGGDLKVKKVNIANETAWKNGVFQFSSAQVPEVMRQLARWYDIEIVYEGAVPTMTFEGGIPRKLPLSEVLDVLKQSELKYRQEGRKLIILP